jgi:uncharacterized membrane protein
MISVQMAVLLLALTVAVTWGFSPIIEKKGLSGGGNPVQASVVFVGVSVFLYWLALVATQDNPVEDLNLFVVVVFGIAGFVGTALGRVAIFEGVERVGPSISSAGVSTRPVFSAGLAWIWLGESLTPSQLIGVAVLVGGLVLVSVSDGGEVTGWKRFDLLFPIGAAGLFGSGFVIRRFGLSETSVTPLQAVAVNETAALLSLAGFGIFGAEKRFEATAKSYGYFLLGGAVTAVGLLAFFTALSVPEGKVASVDPIAATAPLFTVIFSYLFSGTPEKITLRLVVGILLTVSGAVLVAV